MTVILLMRQVQLVKRRDPENLLKMNLQSLILLKKIQMQFNP